MSRERPSDALRWHAFCFRWRKGRIVTSEDIARIVEAHRQDWPAERIRQDPSGFLSVCDALLKLFRDDDPGRPAWLTSQWVELLFGDRPAAGNHQPSAENDLTFFRRH
jgi:hypothetical protein